jgi:hypothetical protein
LSPHNLALGELTLLTSAIQRSNELPNV